MEELMILLLIFTLSQYISVFMSFNIDKTLITSKREFLLWLIPIYTPTIKFYKYIIKIYSELE